MSEKMMTLIEAAERTHLPAATLRYYRHRGDLGPKSFTIGRRVMYRESDVDAWIEAQYQASVS